MNKEAIKDILAIGGSIFGFLGLLYGFVKNRKLRQIEKRANSPFFIITDIQSDSDQKSFGDGDKPYYHYRQRPSDLSAHLWNMGEYKLRIPSDYPDGYPIGLLLKNTGAKLRVFETISREEIIFREASSAENLYELMYVHKKATKDETFRFTLSFETSEGFQDSQVWEVIKGATSIKRVKPKTY